MSRILLEAVGALARPHRTRVLFWTLRVYLINHIELHAPPAREAQERALHFQGRRGAGHCGGVQRAAAEPEVGHRGVHRATRVAIHGERLAIVARVVQHAPESALAHDSA